ncbi:hypothetical protein [Ferrimonas balearica]|uniref:hypothetical protein n=1 Tax=Ferrimonas balearica TaxID=44012 RepID=UPI001C99DA1D|nr:hypothetical protein [Ferrimonas balearica]MBY5991869.1 hypothetical protein [Ferrimonas balearica]
MRVSPPLPPAPPTLSGAPARLRVLLQILALATLFTLVGLLMVAITQPFSFGDAERYLAMAQNPGQFTAAPWGYRVAVPYLAAALSRGVGLPLMDSFALLQLGCYSAFLTLLYLWLRRTLGLSWVASSAACLLFIFSYPGVFNLHNVMHVGLAEHLGILLGCMAIHRGAFVRLWLLIALTCFVKENIGLLLIPTWAFVTWRDQGWRQALFTTAALLVTFIALHLFIRSGWLFNNTPDLTTYTGFYSLDWLHYVYGYWGGLLGALKLTLATFGPVWVLFLLGLSQSTGRLRWMGLLPLLAAMQVVLATDVWRMVGLGAPMVLALSAVALHRLPRHSCVVAVGLNALYFMAFNNSMKLAMAALFALALLGLWFYRQRLNFHFDQPQLDGDKLG